MSTESVDPPTTVLLHEALRMTTRELDQVDTALDAEPRVIPELTALIESV